MDTSLDRLWPKRAHPRLPEPWFVVLAGAIAGGAAGLLLNLRGDVAYTLVAFVAGTIVGLVVSVLAVAEWVGSRRYRLARTVPLDPDAVQVHAARWFGGPPWALSRQQPGELVFWRRLEPNLVTALLLLVMGGLPGILYLVSARGTQTLALRIDPAPAGTDLEILVQPQGHKGRRAVNRFFNSLHEI